jgi:phospholipid-binding lipoprotein MlaA
MSRSSAVFQRPSHGRASRRQGLSVGARCVFLVLLGCAGCASAPSDPEARIAYDEANDPIEPTNRTIFDANQFVDRNALKPVAEAYVDTVPPGIRHGLHNVLRNINEPRVGINDALQGNFDQAWATTQRFVVNTTIGGLGVFDVAQDWDLPHHDADFGQTLGVWGVGEGPFLELPLFGPSNPRDATGIVVGFLMDPFTYVTGGPISYVGYARVAATVLDERSARLADLDEIQKHSLDYYATLRSLYRQHRQDMVDQASGTRPAPGDGEAPAAPPEPAAP